MKASLSYPLRDPKWLKKLLVVTLSYLALVTSPVLIGYYLRVIKQCALESTERLPEISPYSNLWVRGFTVWFATALAVALPGWVVLLLSTLGTSFTAALPQAVPWSTVLAFIGMFPILWLVPGLVGLWAVGPDNAGIFQYKKAWQISTRDVPAYTPLVLFPLLAAVGGGGLLQLMPGPAAQLALFLALVPVLVYLWVLHGHYLGVYMKNNGGLQ